MWTSFIKIKYLNIPRWMMLTPGVHRHAHSELGDVVDAREQHLTTQHGVDQCDQVGPAQGH